MKQGRERVYAFERAPDAAAFGEYWREVAWLEELRRRAMDLIEDVDDATGNALVEHAENSIHYLAMHMVWAEAIWMNRAAGRRFDTEFAELLPQPPAPGMAWSAAAVHGAVRTVADRITHPFVRAIATGSLAMTPLPEFGSLEPLLRHIAWHWTYHSGQVGLLRRLLGRRYAWTFARQRA